MNAPVDLKYSKSDEWIKVEGKNGIIGITDYAQTQLSDVVYVEIKAEAGEGVVKGKEFASIESVKAAADVNAPASGKVLATNDDLAKSPELVNSSPYDRAWMIKIDISDPSELNSLMDAAAYEKYCEERSH